jgi:hypothetical protein
LLSEDLASISKAKFIHAALLDRPVDERHEIFHAKISHDMLPSLPWVTIAGIATFVMIAGSEVLLGVYCDPDRIETISVGDTDPRMPLEWVPNYTRVWAVALGAQLRPGGELVYVSPAKGTDYFGEKDLQGPTFVLSTRFYADPAQHVMFFKKVVLAEITRGFPRRCITSEVREEHVGIPELFAADVTDDPTPLKSDGFKVLVEGIEGENVHAYLRGLIHRREGGTTCAHASPCLGNMHTD